MRKYSDIVYRGFAFASHMSREPSTFLAGLSRDQENNNHWRLSKRDQLGRQIDYFENYALNNDEARDFIELITEHKVQCWVDEQPVRKQNGSNTTVFMFGSQTVTVPGPLFTLNMVPDGLYTVKIND